MLVDHVYDKSFTWQSDFSGLLKTTGGIMVRNAEEDDKEWRTPTDGGLRHTVKHPVNMPER